MTLKRITMGLAALSLIASPTIASAATAAASQPQPAKEQIAGDNAFFGGTGSIVAILALAAIIGGIVAATRGHDRPNSP